MSEKKLPKDVTKALKACQKHLDKVVKYMDEISQRPIAPSKRTADALTRDKESLLESIENLRNAERKHDLTNVASDFIKKNKDVINLCSNGGPDTANLIAASSQAAAKPHYAPADKPTIDDLAQSPGLHDDLKDEPTEDQQRQADNTADIAALPAPHAKNQSTPAVRAEDQPTPDVDIAPPKTGAPHTENQPPAVHAEDQPTPDVDIAPPKTEEASLAADVDHDGENKRKRVQGTESESGHDVEGHNEKKVEGDRTRKKRKSKKYNRDEKDTDYDTTSSESDTLDLEKEMKIFPKKGKDITFRDLPEEEKRKEEEKAKKAIRLFLMEPLNSQIDPHLRRLIRENQAVTPEAATTSRELALECFTTLPMNVICPYHQKSDKSGKTVDGGDGLKFVLNGVPRPRKTVPPAIAQKLKKKASALYKRSGQFRDPRLREGFLHCGCPIDEVLMDFYFWKTWSISGVADGKEVTESLGEQRLTPRTRAFVVKAFEEATCLTIDDLYSGKLPPWRHQEKMYHTQLERILAKYNKLQEEIPGGIKLRLEKDDASGDSEDDGDLA